MSESANAGDTAGAAGAAVPLIPKPRFDEVNERMKAAEAKVAEFTAQAEAARQEQLKAAGKFTELETEYKAKLTAAEAETARLAAIATEYEAQQKAHREATIASLPEAQREYAAKLSPDLLPGFVAALGGEKPKPPKPGEPGVARGGKLTQEEIRANIAKPGWLAENFSRM